MQIANQLFLRYDCNGTKALESLLKQGYPVLQRDGVLYLMRTDQMEVVAVRATTEELLLRARGSKSSVEEFLPAIEKLDRCVRNEPLQKVSAF